MMLEYTASFIVILEGQYYYASYYLNIVTPLYDTGLHPLDPAFIRTLWKPR